MNRKTMPLVLMLIAGGITAFMTFALDYTLKDKLVALLLVLIIFYTIGCIMKGLLNHFDKVNELKASEEGAVIELENEADNNQESKDEKDNEETADDDMKERTPEA